jgi:hypothetical protein
MTKTKMKQRSQTELCLMNGTPHCYMFRFPKNHHQAIRKKKLQITPVPEVFAQFIIEVSLISEFVPVHQVGARGGVVVKALRYKPADGGFDSRWCHWNFSVT